MFLFYFEVKWLSKPAQDWENIKLVVLLNHTSLFEPLFIRLAPIQFIWHLSNNLVAPGADVTLERPIVGKVYKLLLPGCIPITRKNDTSWQNFLSNVHNDAITAILPEGRMKRSSGKDKNGNDMNVRGGIADILEKITIGDLLFIYSGGLHHIHTPGDRYPRFFKKVKVNLELLNIQEYKQRFTSSNLTFKQQVVHDLNSRLKSYTPE
jgi:hypothetical protein